MTKEEEKLESLQSERSSLEALIKGRTTQLELTRTEIAKLEQEARKLSLTIGENLLLLDQTNEAIRYRISQNKRNNDEH